MSLKTWKAEFYPTEASTTKKEEAIDHSLRKWLGLRKAALKSHGVHLKYDELSSPPGYESFVIDGRSCALCVHYFDDTASMAATCTTCPLSIVNDGKSCDHSRGPYVAFLANGNPIPMINLLKKAKAAQK